MALKPARFQIQRLQSLDERFICIDQPDEHVLVGLPVGPNGEYYQDFQAIQGYNSLPGCQASKTVELTQVRNRVPVGYVHLPGSGYYKYHSQHKKFNDARRICALEGGQLAFFNSEAEAKVVAGLPDHELSGTNDLYDEGQFVTVLGPTRHRIQVAAPLRVKRGAYWNTVV
ncbi:hypothetical protein L9F63_014961 [Diploptera punctata]|uniref:C-type lectin domain-containing protein n=1 Tax=Diploptera punctata TaxID=6984 RepID=A0AAD8A7J0_DIPPU|nr:hypothetical protein L9F63_014961 [Diploptera punctata]